MKTHKDSFKYNTGEYFHSPPPMHVLPRMLSLSLKKGAPSGSITNSSHRFNITVFAATTTPIETQTPQFS